MKTRASLIFLAFLPMIFAITACSSGASSTTVPTSSATTLDGATLFQERCSECHSLPTNARGTADQWKAVVSNMVARGANLSSDEQQLVIDYLTKNLGK